MRRLLIAMILLLPVAASAQSARDGTAMPDHSMPMGHMQMMHGGGYGFENAPPKAGMPTQPGQGAFAAIQEIVQILEADPHTDWSKVDIEGLRQHLIDMNNVTLDAKVRNELIDGGMRFIVTGTGAVADSIRRMVSAHAATMDGFGGWHFIAKNIDGGAILDVRVPAHDLSELKALGFIGVLTRGMHQQGHHLMIARGEHPHG